MIEGLSGNDATLARSLGSTVQRLAHRWFVIRDVHARGGVALLQPRWTMSWLRGPMTRAELARARGAPTKMSA